MKNERVYKMTFASVYPLYIQKAERKGRSQAEVDAVITWLTGYTKPKSIMPPLWKASLPRPPR